MIIVENAVLEPGNCSVFTHLSELAAGAEISFSAGRRGRDVAAVILGLAAGVVLTSAGSAARDTVDDATSSGEVPPPVIRRP